MFDLLMSLAVLAACAATYLAFDRHEREHPS